jgi:acetoin utilization deacetylase AcuC-like enzyme
MGFCLYNNIAIAAKAALNSLGAARVFIFDWDVHHGNGTQDAFYEDPRVLFMSVHQSPLYPGSGRIEERGAGKGEGYTLNIPFPPGCSDQDYLYAVQDLCLPALKKYNPDLVLISAGFDAHERDPLASQRLSSQAYASMARMIQLGAEGTQAKGRIVIFLEGGYDRTALAQSVVGVMESLYNRTPAEPPAISGASREAADRVRRIKEKFPEWYG